MEQAFTAMWNLYEERGGTLREAAYTAALQRIGEAIEIQGTHDWFSESS
jgi:glutamate dehydrogenase (NADP+)